ncbi:acyltransferase family protein [Serratia marcescens]|uniref:acyltransferase family protein n=1 Tax=Serratia marcescens TaxID=615 RepID=UPI001F1554CD|nr:acyltransferase [Serratia marcescens]EHT9828788.1 acyltransferase [Serratia marcescens]EIU0969549.1 acyltransferase [Serratia marcescens]MDP8727441.1 acyltransferase [Serratia marcescens]
MKDKIESIQILRGLAAISVVLFHYRYYLVPDGSSVAVPNMLFGWGAIGVDLFFVISGFIMVYITNCRPSGMKASFEFIVNRLTRILPTYYITLLFVFLTGGAMSIFHYPEKTNALISALTFHPYTNSPAPLYINDEGMFNVRWTLNYELYFYLAFSLCLLVRHRLLTLVCWFSFPAILAYFTGQNVTFSTAGYEFNSSLLRFFTNPIIIEFGFGMLSGYVYNHLKGRNEKLFFSLAILTLASTIYLVVIKRLPAYNLSTSLIFSLLVLFFSLSNNIIVKLTPSPVILLGNISFSWYLLHSPLASFISDKVEKDNPNAMHSTMGFIILIIASILVAYLSHKYVEVKLSNSIRRLIQKHTHTDSTIKKGIQAD